MFVGLQRAARFMSPLSWRLGYEVECLGKCVDQGDTLLQSCLRGRREETSGDSAGGAASQRLCPTYTVWWVDVTGNMKAAASYHAARRIM